MKKTLFSKILSAILILTIAVPTVAFAAPGEKDLEICGTFSERSTFKGMKVWYGDDATIPVFSQEPLGWKLQFKSGVKYIYVDVADHLMYDLNGEAIEIEVDYYDEGMGAFTITYDGYEKSDDDAEYVDLTDTKEWKTHTFFIQDAVFKNGLNNADFRIAVTSTYLGFTQSYSKRDDIVFGAVRVKRAGVKSPIRMNITSDATGNIFFEDEKVRMTVDYTNKLKEEYNLNAHILAVDTENRVLWEDSHEISFGKEEKISKTYEFDMERFGLNWLRVTLTDDEGKVFSIKDAEFFYVTTNHGTRLNYDVGTSTHLDQLDLYGEHEKVLPLLVNAGYGRERYDWGWRRFYADFNDYVVNPYMQKLLDDYKDKGIKRTIIVGVANSDFQSFSGDSAYNKGAPSAAFEKDYREYVRATVRATKDYADSYIIGNEQDHASYAPELKLPSSYAEWCRIAYEVIKEEYPEAKVLGYGLTMGDKAWFEETIRLGTHNYFDQPAVHTYSIFNTYEGQDFLGRIQTYWDSVKEKYNVDMPAAWITETGYFHLRHGNYAPYEISQQFPRLYIYAAASDLVDSIVDYTFLSRTPVGYGHLRDSDTSGANDVELPYAPYREYLTIACWNKNFGGDCDFVNSIDGQNTRLYKFKRRSDGKDFAAMWTLNGIENVTLDLGTNEISYMDILGNEEKMYSDDGRYTFNLTEDMKYIIGNFSKFELCDTPKYDFGAEKLGVIEGMPREISVTVDGAKPDGYTISTSDYMKADTTYIGKDSDALTLGVTMRSPEDSYTQKYLCGDVGRSQFKLYDKSIVRDVVSVDVMKDGRLYARCEIPLIEITPITIDCNVSPESVEEINNWQAAFTLKNESNIELSGSFRIAEPSEMAESIVPIDIALAAGESLTVTYAVPASLVGKELSVKAEVTLDSGDIIEYMDKKETFCAVYTDTPPTIDGSINDDEWVINAKAQIPATSFKQLIKTETYSGADDLSGTVNMMWDKENVYMAYRIKDDIHKQANKDGSTWKADGLQIGFTAGENPTAFTHLFAALSDDGYLTKQIYASEDGSNEKGRASDEDFDLAVVRNEGETVYEMRVSWKLIMPLINSVQIGDGGQIEGTVVKDNVRREAVSGETIRFAVLVNDDDGNGRKGYVEYGSDISGANHKNFRNITLFGGEE